MKKPIIAIICLGLAICDQVIKNWTIAGHLAVINHYYIFGLFDIQFLAMVLISSLILFWFGLKMRKQILDHVWVFYLIAGGALSNIFDRIVYTGAIDYLKIHWYGINLIFNLADIMIVAGLILYATKTFKKNSN